MFLLLSIISVCVLLLSVPVSYIACEQITILEQKKEGTTIVYWSKYLFSTSETKFLDSIVSNWINIFNPQNKTKMSRKTDAKGQTEEDTEISKLSDYYFFF